MSAHPDTRKVATFAFYSRILVFLLQFIFNFFLPDHNADVFRPPTYQRKKLTDVIIEALVTGLCRWDAIYFVHIAEYGYTYENTLAFFPLYPLLMRLLANSVFFPLQFLITYRNVLLLSGVILNVVFFVMAASVFHKLSLIVLRDDKLSYRAAQLFCVNPASIFFSATYSESLFAFLSFYGMLKFEEDNYFMAVVSFALSAATRSNGLVNIGFIAFGLLIRTIDRLTEKSVENNAIKWSSYCFTILGIALIFIICLIIHLIPFSLFQAYAWFLYCVKSDNKLEMPSHIFEYGTSRGYKMVTSASISPWCNDILPISYTYIQATHWAVGFLKYYRYEQIPNFILASPMIAICISAMISYHRKNNDGLANLFRRRPLDTKMKKTDEPEKEALVSGFWNLALVPYIVHMTFLLFSSVFFIHVQVITRLMASACPVVYWFSAHISTRLTNQTTGVHDLNLRDAAADEWANKTFWGQLLSIYFHLYLFVGAAAFSNFLPWT